MAILKKAHRTNFWSIGQDSHDKRHPVYHVLWIIHSHNSQGLEK